MRQWNTLIVDDEPIARNILEGYMVSFPQLKLVAQCGNCRDALKQMQQQQIDLVLLDINMPGVNGLEFMKLLDPAPQVIFTTAHAEYAAESYEVNAVDYLLKPVSPERFARAVNKILQPQNAPAAPKEEKQPLAQDKEDFLFVKQGARLSRIQLSELWLVESLGDYVKLHIAGGSKVVYGSLKQFEKSLEPYSSFLRVSKSAIINVHFIREIEGNCIKLREQEIVIGVTFREKVHEYLKTRLI